MSTGSCRVSVTKQRTPTVTTFLAKCRCGWKGKPTGKLKANMHAEIHKSGGEIVR
jgi:hypothetical protein